MVREGRRGGRGRGERGAIIREANVRLDVQPRPAGRLALPLPIPPAQGKRDVLADEPADALDALFNAVPLHAIALDTALEVDTVHRQRRVDGLALTEDQQLQRPEPAELELQRKRHSHAAASSPGAEKSESWYGASLARCRSRLQPAELGASGSGLARHRSEHQPGLITC
ncbi:hypothetical protein NUW54_g7121 [Trametes sanguinea]|uniref:Uncharacterized protein n=1 Tax=Trametes sanguinea TaxID=158606 RepID=A0ACC1PNM2_9APHY|nr:hypothetical protein NUW54_g7121 [Trametes sanguinea]